MSTSLERTKRARTRIDAEAHQLIVELGLSELSGGAIRAEVERQLGQARTPALRTVQLILRRSRVEDESGPWEPDDPRVLEVIPAVTQKTGGLTRWITTEQARRIARIRLLAADLDPWTTYFVARAYPLRSEEIGHWLPFAPWRGEDHRERYNEAVERGWVNRFTPPRST